MESLEEITIELNEAEPPTDVSDVEEEDPRET